MSPPALITDPEMVPAQLTRAQYDALVATGALDGEPVELLEGWLFTMNPQGPAHASLIERLGTALTVRLHLAHGERYSVRIQSPVNVSDRSEPEPDLCVIDAASSSRGQHPSIAHLLVEVAESSQGRDLVHKARIYAAAGFGDYWVVDLPRGETVIHTAPRSSPSPHYSDITRVPFNEPLTVLGVVLRLADLTG